MASFCDNDLSVQPRAHSGNYLQIKIPLCTPKYSPLRPLSSATVAADSGVGGGSDGGSSNTRSSSSNSSSNNEDEAVIGADLLSAAPLQYPGCTTDSSEACCSKKYPVRPTTKNQDYVVSCPEIDGLSILRTEPM
ncbi:hypothetical protein HZH66_007115 [Vespula vulgaris]|uniref:Uncharacterized protein n=1 Tax=Vespula vulgaris TaxID=7454 RepID=A0A834JXB6_VESVU|nr:hypothetical protein HZH66_007115 [Vespula vulgaris]